MSASSPDLRRPSGVGAAGAGSGLTGASLNSADASGSTGAPALSRHCAYPACGKPLVMAPREGPKKFAKRMYCGPACCNKHGFAKERGMDHWPPTKAEFEAWLAKGMSTYDMAKLLNCAHATIIRFRKAYGLAAAHPRGKKVGAKGDHTWNWRDMTKPKRANGKFESVEEWLAAGNEPTICPTAYCAPVISGSPYYSNARRLA